MNNAWWSDEKIDATVNRNYIVSRLPEKERHNLYRPLSFGDGLTDDNYLDWILERGRRLFLILEEIGIPEWIFDAIDQSFDDDDLPISENDLGEFHLSRGKSDALEKKFYRRQFNYLIQELGKGHVDYAENAIVPLESVAKRPGVLAIQSSDKVYRAEKPEVIYTRKRVMIGGDNGVDKIHFVMHLKALSELKHRHLVSVWATYTQGDYGFILLTPSAEITLKAFLDDQPKSFKQIPKQERRERMFGWIQCLTSALAYLHEHGYTHQAIRPSNILLDSAYTIFLGEFSAYQCLDDKASNYRAEIYEYDSPEKWQRTATLQDTAPLRSTLHGGGRTGRKLPSSTSATTSNKTSPTFSPPTNKAAQIFEATQLFGRRGSTPLSINPPATIRSTTTHSSNSSTRSNKGAKALITTFATTPSSFPSDIYSLACIHLLILSSILSHSPKSFSYARSKANRSAGRGGAPADASFHANTEAVQAWMAKLDKEARKKMKDEGVGCFGAVSGVLKVLREGMLRRDVGERRKAKVCESRLGEVIGAHVGAATCSCSRDREAEAEAEAAERDDGEAEQADSESVSAFGSTSARTSPEATSTTGSGFCSRRASEVTTGFANLMGLGIGVGARKASVVSQRSTRSAGESSTSQHSSPPYPLSPSPQLQSFPQPPLPLQQSHHQTEEPPHHHPSPHQHSPYQNQQQQQQHHSQRHPHPHPKPPTSPTIPTRVRTGTSWFSISSDRASSDRASSDRESVGSRLAASLSAPSLGGFGLGKGKERGSKGSAREEWPLRSEDVLTGCLKS